uniref:Plant heme peroxidase family profile domain-containing protein n=1 Tax=Aegilops tauschii subsp. strangulata TaxID=200361 RepID=A0A453RRN8_AEGTS
MRGRLARLVLHGAPALGRIPPVHGGALDAMTGVLVRPSGCDLIRREQGGRTGRGDTVRGSPCSRRRRRPRPRGPGAARLQGVVGVTGSTRWLQSRSRIGRSPFLNASALISLFGTHGFNVQDMVALSGRHTLGVAHCPSFTPRLKFEAATLDAGFASSLVATCSNGRDSATATSTGRARRSTASTSRSCSSGGAC